jgi:hypothetical protein
MQKIVSRRGAEDTEIKRKGESSAGPFAEAVTGLTGNLRLLDTKMFK